MGQHGEIARGYYEQRAGAQEAAGPHEYADRAVAFLMKSVSPAMRPRVREAMRERLHDAYRQAERFGLADLAALDFLYLFDRTRRYNGASIASQFGFVFTPFLSPDLIRASYALRAAGEPFVRDGRELNPLHRYVIETNMPQWRGIEFESDLECAAKPKRRAAAAAAPDAQCDWRPAQGKRYYDYALYWEEVGRPLAESVTSRDGVWTEIFDPDAVRGADAPAPIDIVLVALMAETLESAGL
jgi:hypothetical protein